MKEKDFKKWVYDRAKQKQFQDFINNNREDGATKYGGRDKDQMYAKALETVKRVMRD